MWGGGGHFSTSHLGRGRWLARSRSLIVSEQLMELYQQLLNLKALDRYWRSKLTTQEPGNDDDIGEHSPNDRLLARVQELEAENADASRSINTLVDRVKELQNDAAWRHEWHTKLGRGEAEPEGKFYDRLDELQQEVAEYAEREKHPPHCPRHRGLYDEDSKSGGLAKCICFAGRSK